MLQTSQLIPAPDVSSGPTSLIGLLTQDIVQGLPQYPPAQVASAVALMMGVYSMILGFLKLGFLLEFISLPILSGFISAVAITIALNQVGSLLGEPNVTGSTASQIRKVFRELPQANGFDCLIGFTGILFLVILEHAGKRWGKRNKVIWFLSITRSFLALVLFTGISYAVNHNRGGPSSYLFAVIQVESKGIAAPQIPTSALISDVAGRSVAVFVGAAVEHTAIARAFGVHNNYVTDQSQELCYIGVTNFINSFFHSMGVGGAMSRTAVNSACNVKSPLSGIVTTAVVLISIFKLVGTLYWIPKATLAAIIICAVAPLVHSPKTFYTYWKTSFADFVSSMIAFWVTLFVSTQLGLAFSVGFNIVYFLLRQVFATVHSTDANTVAQSDLPTSTLTYTRTNRDLPSIPSDTQIFQLTSPFFFPNSQHLRTSIVSRIETHHAPAYGSLHGAESERNWSVAGEKRIARLRKAAAITDPSILPPLRLVIFDFGMVSYVDVTGVSCLKALLAEIKRYAGADVEVRFAGVRTSVRERLERAKWRVVDVDANGSQRSGSDESNATDGGCTTVRLFTGVWSAVMAPRSAGMAGLVTEEMEKTGVERLHGERVVVAHREDV